MTALALAAAGARAGDAVSTDREWCVITAPGHAKAGETFTVVVRLKETPPEGMKLGGDLHHVRADGAYVAYARYGGPSRAVAADKTATFTYTMPEAHPGADGVQIRYYLGPGGWKDRIKDAAGAPVLREGAAPPPAAPAATGGNTLELPWAVISAPKSAAAGAAFKIQVRVKEAAEGLRLGGDAHRTGAGGQYIGYGFWGGEPRAVRAGETVTFTYTMPAAEKGSTGVYVHYFLSPKGWEERVKDGRGPVVALANAPAPPGARPASAGLKRSWIKLGEVRKGEAASGGAAWVEGDEAVLPIAYYVDPADDWGGTGLRVEPHGPWVDNPDGKYTKTRAHHNYPGLRGATLPCEVGRVAATEFRFKIPAPFGEGASGDGLRGDGLLFVVAFHGKDGKAWPWRMRTSLRGGFAPRAAFFRLAFDAPGRLFTYGEPVAARLVLGARAAGQGARTVRYEVFDTTGAKVYENAVPFQAREAGQSVALPVATTARGVLRLSAAVEGWGARETTFARIPDLAAVVGDGPTPFGGQKFSGRPEAVAAARKLGMGACRVWVSWINLQPARDVWNEEALAALGREIDDLNARRIRPWILFDQPPPWAIASPAVWQTHFNPFPFEDADVDAAVTRLATAFKGRISGFEWLNEIVPGHATPTPVEDYLRFCRVATAAARRVDPGLRIQLSGGLWPQSFLKSVLAAGAADFVDILPIHYGSGTGIRRARADLAAVGAAGRVAVWDNETARGGSTWGMPLAEALRDRRQGDWMLEHFADELLAGAERIVLFGGEPDPAGNWSHFWGDLSPRPSAATLAVIAAKLSKAEPLGEFSMAGRDRFRLFKGADGRPVLVASSVADGGETIRLPAGGPLTATDHQGNECPVAGRDGTAEIPLSPSPYFLEGGDLDILAAQLVVRAGGEGEGMAQATFVRGLASTLPVEMRNAGSRPWRGTVSLWRGDGGDARIEGAPRPFSLAPGERAAVALPFMPERIGALPLAVRAVFDDGRLPAVERAVRGWVVDPARVGNRVANPGFEAAGDAPAAADGWGGSGRHGRRVPVPPEGARTPGLGAFVYEFRDTAGGYRSIGQGLDAPEPGEYVYSAWIRTDDLTLGSNASLTDAAGKTRQLTWMDVFQAPANTARWDVYRARIAVPPDAKRLGFAPVARGPGRAFLDNVVLARYEGTEYVAFAPRRTPAAIDGDLGDFDRSAPIPLFGKSQLRAAADDYAWTPENLGAAAWFNWDEKYLYVGVEVRDDRHVARLHDERCVEEDSVEVALHPFPGLPGADDKAFAYYLGAAAPGGSGRHTLFRPKAHSGGLASGSLARDSSLYDFAVRRGDGRTVYEAALPWSELGGVAPAAGARLGLSLAAHDNDGRGRAASMLWGEGLAPAWSPAAFGLITLTP